MGCDKLNNEDKRPASDLSRRIDPLALSISNSGASEGGVSLDPNWCEADILTFNCLPQSIANPTWEKMNMNGADFSAEVPEADVKLMADLLKLNSMQNLQMDPMSDDARSSLANRLSIPDMSVKSGDIITTDLLQGGSVQPCGIQVPMLDMNMMATGNNTVGSTQMPSQGRQRKGTSVKRLEYSSTVGCSTSDQLNRSENIDGSFLTLGIGGDAVVRSKREFSAQEVATSLEEAFCSQNRRTHIQEVTTNFSNPAYNMNGDMTSIQNNSNRLPNVSGYSGGWSACNNDGVFQAPQAAFRSTPSHGFSVSKAGIYHDYNANSYGNLGHIGNAHGSLSELSPFRVIQGDQAPPSLPFNSNFSYAPQFGSNELSGLGVAPDKLAWVATQPSANHFQNSLAQSSINTSSGFSSYPHSPQFTATSVGQLNENRLASVHEADSVHASNTSIPRRMQGRARNVSFPKRLAVQPNSGATQAVLEGEVHQPQSTAVQLSSHLRGTSYTLGQPEAGMPQNPLVADSTTGCQATIEEKADAYHPGSFHGQPSVKRRASAPLTASTGQRRKIALQPNREHSMPYMHQGIPASNFSPVPPALDHTVPPPAPDYIKRKGTEQHIQPLGHKCFLCKRDLSYEPEGPILQPPIAPPVAVLPCGHTFHDHCLQLITPNDQSKDPPCIPCAIGET